MWRKILPEFDEYSYIHEADSKPGLPLFWIRDSMSIFKKATIFLINSFKVDVNNIDKIKIVVGRDHGQGVFLFPMKLIYVMDDEEIFERITNIDYIRYRKDNGTILKKIIVTKLWRIIQKNKTSFFI